MLNADEDALICDLAETYGIYSYRSLPVSLVATFSVGLRDDSRIKMILRGQNYSTEEFLMATMVDRLSFLVWAKTEDAAKNRNRPISIVENMLNKTSDDSSIIAFNSAEEFETKRKELIERREK